jgi:hypothetical protein
MAPELFSGRRYGNPFATDVYSFALIMWFIVTGIKPYEEYIESTEDDFNEQIGKFHKRPQLNPAHFPEVPKLRRLIHLCWHKNPAKRPRFEIILECLLDIKSKLCNTDLVLTEEDGNTDLVIPANQAVNTSDTGMDSNKTELKESGNDLQAPENSGIIFLKIL